MLFWVIKVKTLYEDDGDLFYRIPLLVLFGINKRKSFNLFEIFIPIPGLTEADSRGLVILISKDFDISDLVIDPIRIRLWSESTNGKTLCLYSPNNSLIRRLSALTSIITTSLFINLSTEKNIYQPTTDHMILPETLYILWEFRSGKCGSFFNMIIDS